MCLQFSANILMTWHVTQPKVVQATLMLSTNVPPTHESHIHQWFRSFTTNKMYTSTSSCNRLLNFICIPHDLAISNFVYFTNSFPLFSGWFSKELLRLRKKRLSWNLEVHETRARECGIGNDKVSLINFHKGELKLRFATDTILALRKFKISWARLLFFDMTDVIWRHQLHRCSETYEQIPGRQKQRFWNETLR